MYIQQADGTKCVWAFNFLFVSEGRLIELKLLLSNDPNLSLVFCFSPSCPCFCLSLVYYLNGVMKHDFISLYKNCFLHFLTVQSFQSLQLFNMKTTKINTIKNWLTIMPAIILWAEVATVLFCFFFCVPNSSCVRLHPADGCRWDPKLHAEGCVLWIFILSF